jgi:hypothetical protein
VTLVSHGNCTVQSHWHLKLQVDAHWQALVRDSGSVKGFVLEACDIWNLVTICQSESDSMYDLILLFTVSDIQGFVKVIPKMF